MTWGFNKHANQAIKIGNKFKVITCFRHNVTVSFDIGYEFYLYEQGYGGKGYLFLVNAPNGEMCSLNIEFLTIEGYIEHIEHAPLRSIPKMTRKQLLLQSC